MKKLITNKSLYILAFLAICRICSMIFIPLNDTTEARYAEIARKMLESGDWITPMMDIHQPFWGKPPLSFWLSALSMNFFGVNAFAARLPSFIAAIGTILLVRALVKTATRQTGTTATLLLAGNLFFFLDAGTVMTEPTLLFALSLAMWSFWQAMDQKNLKFSLAFFTALGIGLLSKGPIAMVLIGGALFIWTVWNHQWHKLRHNLHWFLGILWTLAIALPWYMLAEYKTPGFLDYFIIGEHFRRYVQPGWSGDQYGYVHAAPMGTIWLYALGATLPWGFVFINYSRKSNNKQETDPRLWHRYLLSWILFPLIFFTPARNIIYPYVFPILPALALWVNHIVHLDPASFDKNVCIIRMSTLSTGILFLLASYIFSFMPQWPGTTQEPVIARWQAEHPEKSTILYYWTSNPLHFSALFYTQGKARALHDYNQLCTLLETQQIQYLVIEDSENNPLPACAKGRLLKVEELHIGQRINILMKNQLPATLQ